MYELQAQFASLKEAMTLPLKTNKLYITNKLYMCIYIYLYVCTIHTYAQPCIQFQEVYEKL